MGSYSGYNSTSMDFDRPDFTFDLGASDEALGEGLLTALSNSRPLSKEEDEAVWIRGMDDYNAWVKRLMKTHGHKTKGDMMKPFFSCTVDKEKEGYLFAPTHQRALNGWEGNEKTKANKFTIPLTATAAEMGVALRRCLALCTSKFDPPKDA